MDPCSFSFSETSVFRKISFKFDINFWVGYFCYKVYGQVADTILSEITLVFKHCLSYHFLLNACSFFSFCTPTRIGRSAAYCFTHCMSGRTCMCAYVFVRVCG